MEQKTNRKAFSDFYQVNLEHNTNKNKPIIFIRAFVILYN